MATTPQGNFAAYKELKYREQDRDKTVDFINLGIDRLIKEGKARDAAKLKAAQEEGKTYYEAVKDIKVEPIQTVSMFQDFDNKAFNETFDAVAEAKRITQDPNIPNSVKQKYSQIALEKWKGFQQLKTFLGDEKQIKLFTDKLQTDTSKIWRGDEGLKIMRAVKANAITYGFDNNGRATIKFLDPDSNEVIEKDFNSATQAVINPYTEELINKKDGLYDQMRQEVIGMLNKDTNGIGGNRTTEKLKFDPKKAERSFDIRFGEYNLNNDDMYLKQFAYDVLGNRTIQNKEDWDKVKKAYVDKMDIYVKEETSTVDKYMPIDIKLKEANLRKTNAQIEKMQEKEQQLAVPTAETSIIRTYNADGSYQGYYTGKTAAVSLPGTTNFLAAQPIIGKNGKLRNNYYIGGFAKDGNIVYEPISTPMTVMTSAKIKNPVKFFAELNEKAKSLTPIKNGTRQKIVPKSNSKSSEYELTSVNIKAKAEDYNPYKEFQNSLYQGFIDNQNQ